MWDLQPLILTAIPNRAKKRDVFCRSVDKSKQGASVDIYIYIYMLFWIGTNGIFPLIRITEYLCGYART